jgi:Tfp pilus assembly protein FimT
MSTRRGATLIELVLVMMVIFTMAMVVAPRFSDFMPSLQVRSAANGLFATAGKARADAVLTGARHRLVIDPGARTYGIAYEPRPVKEPGKFEKMAGAWAEEELPREVVLESTDGFSDADGKRFLEFRPDGTAKEASIVLANDRGDRRTIKISAATGAARIEAPQ